MTPKFLFDKLPNLETLDLSRNMLPKIERYTFEDISKLRVLNLAGNGIEFLDSNSFDRNPELSELHLENNAIRKIEDVFPSLEKLSILNLTENRISFIDYSMFPINLNTLLIAHNRIAQLTSMIAEGLEIRLKNLDMSFNKLTFLNGLLIPVTLVDANFSHNLINSLGSHTFYNKANLRSVDLRHNQIALLNESGLATLTESLYDILLAGNPLQCTCNMDWMKKQERGLIAGMPRIADYSQILCTQSHTGKTREILKFQSSDLLCPYDVICSEDCPCCDFDSCDCKNVCPKGFIQKLCHRIRRHKINSTRKC